MLNHALDLGFTLIDTARAYGSSEERIGRHLARLDLLDDELHLALVCLGVSAQEDEARVPASREALTELVKPWQVSGKYRPYRPVGCVDCRMTGYHGRMGLYELLVVTETFKSKVSREPVLEALRSQAVKDGMRPLRLAGAARVAEGLTTLDEVLACTPPVSG